jgi:c-di-GMP-binding flagellar brake protein YcgR
MGTLLKLDPQEMDALILSANTAQAPVSLRTIGSLRILGDLHVAGLEPGTAIHLMGAKRRDILPAAGTEVNISMLMGDEVYAIRTAMLDPIIYTEDDHHFPHILRVAWPAGGVEHHRREAVRVARPDMPPLKAQVRSGNDWLEAHLLNLTETGIGLGVTSSVPIEMCSQVEVRTELPGDLSINLTGEVRHVEAVYGEAFSTRLGMVVGSLTNENRELLRRFIQARRTVRSQMLRSES